MKLTVKEYSSRFKVSPQAVYQKIDKGLLKVEIVDGVKHVLVDDEEVKALEQEPESWGAQVGIYLAQLVEQVRERDVRIAKLETRQEVTETEWRKSLKAKDKEIKRLTKSLEKARQEEVNTLKEAFFELKALKQIQLAAPVKKQEEEAIDLEEVKPKKDKKKNKKKGKKK